MNKKAAMMLALAVVLLAGAAFRFSLFLRQHSPSSENTYFYDLSERKLFVAPRTLVPPIRGINNDEPDGRFEDVRLSRSVWSACVFSAAFPRRAAI